MEIYLELPKTRKGKDALGKQLAKLHSEYATRMIRDLPCPIEQKLALVDAIVNDVHQNQKRT